MTAGLRPGFLPLACARALVRNSKADHLKTPPSPPPLNRIPARLPRGPLPAKRAENERDDHPVQYAFFSDPRAASVGFRMPTWPLKHHAN